MSGTISVADGKTQGCVQSAIAWIKPRKALLEDICLTTSFGTHLEMCGVMSLEHGHGEKVDSTVSLALYGLKSTIADHDALNGYLVAGDAPT